MIEFQDVSLAFGKKEIFNRINFLFEAETVYFIQGASGVGKTTLLNLCAGYIQPEGGRIACDGEIEYLFQSELLFSELTVKQNLNIRALAQQDQSGTVSNEVDQIGRALEQVGVGHLVDSIVRDLSGGERRRVEIAGALIGTPRVLLLDEPVGSLDPDNAVSVYETLWQIRKGRTIIVVTHEPNLLNAPHDAVILQLQPGGKISVLRSVA